MASNRTTKAWFKTRSGRVAALLGISGLFVLVFWLTMKSRQMLAAPSMLAIDEQYLSIGEVWADPAYVVILPIRNTTNDDVEVAGFETSCSCGKIEPSSLTIPSHGSAEVRLTIDLSSANAAPNLVAKDFQISARPRIPKGSGPQTSWVVRGKVAQPFASDPPAVDFEESLVRGQHSQPRSVSITCGLDVAELTTQCDSPFITTRLQRESANPMRFRLEVQARTDMPNGFFNHLVRLTALTANKTQVSGAVPVMGRVIEDVRFTPEVLAFGGEPVGARRHETVVLRSHSGAEFSVQEVDTAGMSGISVELGQKRKDGSQPLVVKFVVEHLGQKEHTIHVRVNVRQGLLDLSLPLICHGIPAPKENDR